MDLFEVTKSNVIAWIIGSILLSLIVLEAGRGLWQLLQQAVTVRPVRRPTQEIEEEAEPPRRSGARRVITRE